MPKGWGGYIGCEKWLPQKKNRLKYKMSRCCFNTLPPLLPSLLAWSRSRQSIPPCQPPQGCCCHRAMTSITPHPRLSPPSHITRFTPSPCYFLSPCSSCLSVFTLKHRIVLALLYDASYVQANIVIYDLQQEQIQQQSSFFTRRAANYKTTFPNWSFLIHSNSYIFLTECKV